MGVVTDVADDHPMAAWLRAEREAALAPAEPKFYGFSESVKFAVGLDIGQASDPSAVCVVQHTEGVLDHGSAFERNHGLSKQTPAVRLDVRFLQRLPLRLSYPRIVEHVAALMQRPPLCDCEDVRLVADQTGVGAGVLDLVEGAGLRPIRCTITGASVTDVHWTATDRVNVSKMHLVSLVDAALSSGTLRFASALPEAATLQDELLSFTRKVSDSGRSSYAAQGSKHDDCVMALSLAVWFLSQPPPRRLVLQGY